MAKLGNMHDVKTPIPGILYAGEPEMRANALMETARKSAKKIKDMNLSKSEICFLILSLIKEMGLNQKDFNTLDLGEFGAERDGEESEYGED